MSFISCCAAVFVVGIVIGYSGVGAVLANDVIPEMKWSRGECAEPEFVLPKAADWSLPSPSIGFLALSGGGAMVADDISGKVIVLSSAGDVLKALGNRGQGPDDYCGRYEPIVWPGCEYAISDCASRARVVCYDSTFAFMHVITVGSSERTYLRVLGNESLGVAVSMTYSGSPVSGMEIDIYLEVLNSAGLMTADRHIRSLSLPSASESGGLTDRDFEIVPNVAIDDDGMIYVQPDVYRWDIACYDAALEVVWVSAMSIELKPAGDYPHESSRFSFDPSPYAKPVVGLLPVSDGGLWLVRGDVKAVGGGMVVSVLGDSGEYRGEAEFGGEVPFGSAVDIRGCDMVSMIGDSICSEVSGHVGYCVAAFSLCDSW